ncbi:MAG: Gfo/Idh/MocA family oxidoreductase [Phycisphaerae bacterium]|jgi:predicted dehydrogenase|nr:Gfo/Idh/MocA family oxidoreductase [Phycisphaerae bacterium]MCZ2398288.1 Gfo/Idh/MocA family oxidoreductase [Phycisphaerae bacterium]
MNDPLHASRRDFFKTAAAAAGMTLAGAAAASPRAAAAHQDHEPERPAEPSPFRDLRIAFIGVGGMGFSHVTQLADLGVQCPCFADVDTNMFGPAKERFQNAKEYQDYRVMLEKEHANIDGVIIATPDHHHYPATMLAMQRGKHVYTQKPLTHTPWEARQLAEAAQRFKVATQMGNQGHAGEGWRLVYEYYHGGHLGDVREVHTWTDRPIWPQGIPRSVDEDVPPRHLAWDLWLGPAPERPFRREAYHRFNWRGWWDFGAGALGDMACHTMDGLHWVLNPGHPTVIEPIAQGEMNGETFPKASMIRWEYPASDQRPAFVSYWYDGGLRPQVPEILEAGRKLPSTGNLFVGTKATLLVSGDYGESPRIIPESKAQEIGKPARLLERSPGHMEEWLLAIKGDQPLDFPKSNFAYAGPFSEKILLGNIALRVGRRLVWDGANMKFTNCPEANAFVTKEYRSGWRV